jgi:NADH dehydrogenase
VAYLAGFRNRVSVMLEWAYAYFTYRPGARLIVEQDRLQAAASAAANMERRRAS